MPQTPDWQLVEPIQAIMFDCDGTLSTIEGIDELAEQNNVGDIVQALTAKAMAETGINPKLYNERLQHVKPRLDQVKQLATDYFMQRTKDSFEVIQLLQRLKKTVYVVSAGINPAVTLFAKQLDVPDSQVFAVDVTYDANGNYQDFDHSSLLASRNGKKEIAAKLKQKHGSVALIGDGMNDVVAIDVLTRFIGYGGTIYREKVEKLCEYYVRDMSMSCILPLLLTEDEYRILDATETALYHRGLEAMQARLSKIGNIQQ